MSVLPTDSLETPRFCGVPTFMRLPMATDLSQLDAAIIGLPSDSGAPFRTGARFGPNAVRAMSTMLRPINPYRNDINVFDTLRCADAGDAPVVPGYEEECLARIEQAVYALSSAGVVPCGIGGDHSITLAELRAVAKVHGPLALVQFDSHSDTWDKYFADKRYSAGTPFRRAVEEDIVDPAYSIQVGLRGSLFRTSDITQSLDLGYEVFTTDQMFELGIKQMAQRIAERTAGRPTFITFDMDFVDPAFAPGVQTPEAGGPSAREALLLLRALKGINMVGCDVTEISPMYDGPGQITSLLGATVMAELLALLASERAA
ncbi:agmatinase [Rouxiella badensis]|jgi:agmatinase|uniref:agmatinase n=1 Tax=Rouxiella badensis TaxID=1646377 RepID=UPI0013EF11AD|nr:agmatinase [Rouxiella badensis]MCC3704973.1 agmatinase [Rouxiella badensis]MCC3721431.1 agmatinase [Rouxiella badensis]MCC3730996.1 agmatinase [Rouxiella badensis]MCC3735213.1 agmatinase [Rouxiella badensis]MCC3742307.1 agmatinase [Rouxiella badensis]